MISVPTTLVLGAGASKPYGFPSGYELRQLLCNREVIRHIYPYGFDQRDIDIFSTTFLKSEMPSIDAFLARRGSHKVGSFTNATFADIGKAAIAYCLIQRENPDLLHNVSEDHWYQYLWSFLSDSLELFGDNKLRIITFNYDRSLEHYLMTALQNSFGISPLEAAEQVKKIPILHVYGQLAEIPELTQQGLESRSYTSDISYAAKIHAAAKGIRVIDESRDDDMVFETAYSYLCEAQKICFLGFGFDETNVRRLRIAELIQNIRVRNDIGPKIFATTLGFAEAERALIVNKLNTSKYPEISNPTRENISPYRTSKTEQYLRSTGVFIS